MKIKAIILGNLTKEQIIYKIEHGLHYGSKYNLRTAEAIEEIRRDKYSRVGNDLVVKTEIFTLRYEDFFMENDFE